MEAWERPPLPRAFRAWLAAAAAVPFVFLATGPWHVAGRPVERLAAPLAAGALLALAGLARRDWRSAARGLLRNGIRRVSRRRVALASAAAALVLGRILVARFEGLALSAWDTTIFYDRPLAETFRGRPFFCDFIGGSTFGNHVTALLLAFLPAYAVHATPAWLLAAEAVALAAGAGAGFFVFRRTLQDDLAAAFLAAAFLLDAHTAKTLQYGFHPEAFYPLAIFVLWLGLLEDRPALLAAGMLLAVSVKEDSILVLWGFAVSAAVMYRRRRVAAVAALAGALAYFVSARLVLPHFSGEPAGSAWYGSFWASWASTPPRAALAMLRHPGRLAFSVAGSGAADLLEPLAFSPLAGPEGLLASLPALVPYAASDHRPLRAFALYYAMPVLPFLFVGAASCLRRITRSMTRRRLGALLILALCAFDGAGYTLPGADPGRRDIDRALAAAGNRPVRVQGTLYPHAGYARNVLVLDGRRPIVRGDAVLLALGTNPYPFTAAQMQELVDRLSADPAWVSHETPHGLRLFLPARDVPPTAR